MTKEEKERVLREFINGLGKKLLEAKNGSRTGS